MLFRVILPFSSLTELPIAMPSKQPNTKKNTLFYPGEAGQTLSQFLAEEEKEEAAFYGQVVAAATMATTAVATTAASIAADLGVATPPEQDPVNNSPPAIEAGVSQVSQVSSGSSRGPGPMSHFLQRTSIV